MSILGSEARNILESAGYVTIPGQTEDIFSFEDATLLGFVWVTSSVTSILSEWQRKQDGFLRDRDRELRRSKEKSWNVYSVFLTEDDAKDEQHSELAKIEEDFRGTRKIARSGVRSMSQINRALLPLLPIQNRLSLGDIDVASRLRTRLAAISKNVADALLQQTTTDNAVDLILDADENS